MSTPEQDRNPRPPGAGDPAGPVAVPPSTRSQPPDPPGDMPRQGELAASLLGVLLAVVFVGVVLAVIQAVFISQPEPASAEDPFRYQLDDDAAANLSSGIVFNAMLTLVYLAVLAVLLGKLREGSRAARVILTALLLITTPSALSAFGETPSGIWGTSSLVLSIVQACLHVAILVLLWQKPVSTWIDASTVYNEQYRRSGP